MSMMSDYVQLTGFMLLIACLQVNLNLENIFSMMQEKVPCLFPVSEINAFEVSEVYFEQKMYYIIGISHL